jgi:uncharacterized protein (TIGR02594 family)
MFKTRRTILATLVGVPAALAAINSRKAFALPDGVGIDKPISFPEGQRVPTLAELEEATVRETGTEQPYLAEIRLARQILAASPRNETPIGVASYFQLLRHGEFISDFGNTSPMYSEEWPVRANPIIVSFFDATSLRKPSGDQTHWCAAFVNWCYQRSRKITATGSAASETFRRWGTKTSSPKVGDIVVFENKSVSRRGHVGFYIGERNDSIFVLGGNQRPSDKTNTGEVNVRLYRKDGEILRFHSYRTDDSLHGE